MNTTAWCVVSYEPPMIGCSTCVAVPGASSGAVPSSLAQAANVTANDAPKPKKPIVFMLLLFDGVRPPSPEPFARAP
jgi:hypothetical protein